MASTRNVLVFLFLSVSLNLKLCCCENLQVWFEQVSDPKFDCPIPFKDGNLGDSILSVVACDEPGAIYSYDYKVTSFNAQLQS